MFFIYHPQDDKKCHKALKWWEVISDSKWTDINVVNFSIGARKHDRTTRYLSSRHMLLSLQEIENRPWLHSAHSRPTQWRMLWEHKSFGKTKNKNTYQNPSNHEEMQLYGNCMQKKKEIVNIVYFYANGMRIECNWLLFESSTHVRWNRMSM